MSLRSPLLRRFVKRVIVETAGVASPTPSQSASAFDTLCERLRRRLLPLFGTPAIEALFARALHLATTDFPWLVKVIPPGAQQCSLDQTAPWASEIPLADLDEALAAVLAYDVALLSEFVGSDLIYPLVQDAWGSEMTREESAGTVVDHE